MRDKTTVLCRRTRVKDTTPLKTKLEKKFKVIHPFHPLYSQQFNIEEKRKLWGRNYFIFHADSGQRLVIPIAWTDMAEEDDPFVVISAGRSYFRVEDLLSLSELLKGLLE
jgi:hypothetical protein